MPHSHREHHSHVGSSLKWLAKRRARHVAAIASWSSSSQSLFLSPSICDGRCRPGFVRTPQKLWRGVALIAEAESKGDLGQPEVCPASKRGTLSTDKQPLVRRLAGRRTECARNVHFKRSEKRNRRHRQSSGRMRRAARLRPADLGFCLLVTAALDELSSLPPDLLQRGPKLGPSFVNLMELPPRFARSERDEEPAAQAGHLRMIAKPTDGLLVCLAAARTGNFDLGMIERAFGHDASPWEKPRGDSMALPLAAVHRHPPRFAELTIATI
jgi:hypothetical protein